MRFDPQRRLEHDPLGLVRAREPEDREVAAHIAALLAYGRVAALRRAISEVFDALGPSLTEALRAYEVGTFVRLRPDFVYRMTRAEDIDSLLAGLSVLLREYGTLAAAFAAGDRGVGDARAPLEAYVATLRRSMDCRRRGARYLTPDPRSGSATKRWYLMLRWLARRDEGVDPGLWTHLDASRLVLPLDTHVLRMVNHLGLTDRRTADYRTAREATDGLLRISPGDPLRYDMVLCHMGISGECAHRYVAPICSVCDLAGVCRWTP